MSESSSPSRPASPVGELPNLTSAARPYRFTWDPSSHKRGPESVSETTEGRGADNFAAQPQLGFLNTSSVSLALGALPSEWSSSKHGFHAISTVLNNPHKRQAPPKAHSALPPIVPNDLPRVRRKDFDSYLRAITPEWERFERNTQLGREGVAQLDGQSTPRASLSSTNTASTSAQRIPHATAGKSIPSLDSVPAVFFDLDFNLGNPRTFATVTEQDPSRSVFDESNDPSALSHSLPLLEKFSHYADTVEQHLIREISLRSTSFFAALTNLNELQTESEQCLDRIGKLRGLLHEVDEKGAKKGLQVIAKEDKLDNLGKVRESVKVVGGVVEMTGVARELVSAGGWGEALEVIEDMEALWEGRPSSSKMVPDVVRNGVKGTPPNGTGIGSGRPSPLPPTPEEEEEEEGVSKPSPPPSVMVPLSSLNAFAALPTHLRTLTMEIASSLSSELTSVLHVDLTERINTGTSKGSYDGALKSRLRPLLEGLVRTKGLKEATLSWREIVMGEMKGVVQNRLPTFDIDDDDPRATNAKGGPQLRTGLANHLRNLPHAEFIGLIQDIYARLLNGVEGLQAQGVLIVEMLQAVRSQSPPNIPALEEELSDILSSAAELSNTQAAKVITFRAEQHASLELPDFLVFFDDSWNFVVKCEVISRRMIVGLRGVVVSQAKVFLQTFHQARISQSAKLVEDEQWNPSEVSPSLQHITDVLVDSAVHDSPELVISLDNPGTAPSDASPPVTNGSTRPPQSPSAPPSKPNGTSPSSKPAPDATSGSGSGGVSSKHLRIEDRTYFTVSATSEVLVLLLDYLKVIVNLSMLTTDTMSRVIEFLKAFNSRTCQVVLGAGAMRSAGLKNITAKHLALASQSLSIMFELIPYVRETFRRHLSPKQAVMLVEFDKLKRDYQEHQNEIHTKLIAIMGDRLTAHIKTLQGVDWNVPKPGGGVNDYMEILVKETVTLHKVLSRYLSTPIVEYVMTQVFAAINHRLSEEYGKIELPHQEAKTRLLADAKFLHQKLAALKNVGTPSGMLETVIAEKSIPRKNVPTPTRSNSMAITANQRLKGLLSGRSTMTLQEKLQEKALPIRTPSPPPVLASPSPPLSSSPAPSTANSISGGGGGVVNGGMSSVISLPLPPSGVEVVPSGGFRQVEDPPPRSGPEEVEEHISGSRPPPLSSPPSDHPSGATSPEGGGPPASSSPVSDAPASSLSVEEAIGDVEFDGRSGSPELSTVES